MNQRARDLLAPFSDRFLLLDSGLLLLYLLGATDRGLIGPHGYERVRKYSIADYDLLCEIVDWSRRLEITPNTLTEVSNLSLKLDEDRRRNFRSVVATNVVQLEEQYVRSADVVSLAAFPNFGVTDGVLIYLARGVHLIITDDFALSGYLAKHAAAVVNFNHARDLT